MHKPNQNRYQRHLALPEITPAHQQKLQNTKILMIGAGGLGAAALAYLAGAGIGEITIADHDNIDITNLHRQTIFRTDQTGENKAEAAADYLQRLNPDITTRALAQKITSENALEICSGYDLILDGSDNFATKSLLNDISIQTQTPLLSASVNQYEGQIGLFAGFTRNHPCYRCLFPELPEHARNCNEAGVLGTAAGLTGLYQAHIALCFLLDIGENPIGRIFVFDFKNMRQKNLNLAKNPECPLCGGQTDEWENASMTIKEIRLVPPSELDKSNTLVIDVRQDYEVTADPIAGALHIELSTLPSRYKELPRDKLLAFACAANVRSLHAAQFMQSVGYDNICVYDKLAA